MTPRPDGLVTVETRSFLDENGVRWEVREICDPSLAIIPRHQLRRPEFAAGWLLFTSDGGGRRRFAPYPAGWHETSDGELRDWCHQAMDAVPVRHDVLDGPPTRTSAPTL
jgi:hypothetical protein